MAVHVLWESQLEYHICRNNWEEVSKLLDLIPDSLLVYGSLQVSLDCLHPTSTVECDGKSSDYGNYLCSLEELDAVSMDVQGVKILRFPAIIMGSVWLKMLMEEKLARKLIFLKEYWEGTVEIVPLLARSGFVTTKYKIPSKIDPMESLSDLKSFDGGETLYPDMLQSLHKLLLHHCVHCNLPCLLDLYLDHHELVVHKDSLFSLLDAAVSF